MNKLRHLLVAIRDSRLLGSLYRLPPTASSAPASTSVQAQRGSETESMSKTGTELSGKPNPWTGFFARMPKTVDLSKSRLMAGDSEAIQILRSGSRIWNQWRDNNWLVNVRAEWPNLYRANLQNLDLSGASLWSANLELAEMSGANLSDANLKKATLKQANLQGANLRRADLSQADLMFADLRNADLRESLLDFANLCGANLEGADLTGSLIFGISAWDVKLDGAIQRDLVVTRYGEPLVTTDNIGLGQLMYLLIENSNLRRILDTLTTRTVLILGRFSPERKQILDAIRNELRKRDYLPILFDFEKPSNRDITETVSTLAYIARFVIADITDARSIPQELKAIVPNLPSVPIQPLLLSSQHEFSMFEHFRRFPWVLEPFLYNDQHHLLASIDSHIIRPAEIKAREQVRA
jgi:hypothetical protein